MDTRRSNKIKGSEKRRTLLSVKKNDTSFAGDLMRLFSGTGVASVVSLLATPVLTRLFSPEAFGISAFFTAIVVILSSLSCLRYEVTIVLPKDSEEASNLLGLSFIICILLALFLTLVAYFFTPLIADWADMPALGLLLYFLPLAVFLNGIYSSLSFWNTRTKHFSRLSISSVFEKVSSVTSKIMAGSLGYISGGVLIICDIMSKIVSTLILAVQFWQTDGRFFIYHFSLPSMWSVFKQYKKFPFFGIWSTLLAAGAWQLPVLLLGFFFSPLVAGLYVLGFHILQMPMYLFGSAIGKVFMQRAAEAYHDNELSPLVKTIFEKLVQVSLFPMLLLTIMADDLYTIAFGARWEEAGVYTQILSIWAFFWFLSGPFTSLFSILDKQEVQLKWNIFNFSIRLLSIMVGGYYGSALLAISLLGVSGTFIYGWKVFLTLHYSSVRWQYAALILIKYFCIFIPAGLFLVVLKILFASAWITLGGTVLMSGLYVLYIIKFIYPELLKLKRNLKKHDLKYS
jgi:O-antigen/teichoic acid export membrane protein